MLLPDIVQYYANDEDFVADNQYKRKPNSEPEILGECHLCGVLLDSECEIVVDGKETFCSDRCKSEFENIERNGENYLKTNMK